MNTTEPTPEGGKDWDAKGAMYKAFNVPNKVAMMKEHFIGLGAQSTIVDAMQAYSDQQNADIRAALAELILIAEWLKSEYPIDFYLYFKESAIENAKLLTNDKDNV